MSWTADYLRLRFKMGGRIRPEVDCWGLYRLIVGERKGIWLDEFGGNESRYAIARTMATEVPGSEWLPVTSGKEREFDMVMMRGLVGEGRGTVAAALHVGCVAEPGILIDIEETNGVMVRAFRGDKARPEMRNRVLGIYRPAAVA
jgi:hypothetical protein